MVSMIPREGDEVLHAAAIESLAEEMKRPVDEVRATYLAELHRLQDGARIHDYIKLFTVRRTREFLASH
jgi:hypothetical protein